MNVTKNGVTFLKEMTGIVFVVLDNFNLLLIYVKMVHLKCKMICIHLNLLIKLNIHNYMNNLISQSKL